MSETHLKGALDKYLSELSGRSITPGGGSAAALTAALGVGLNLMVLNYSIKETEDASSASEILTIREEQKKSLENLSILIDEDCRVFKELMKALSSGGDAENEYKAAASVPMDICTECSTSIEATSFLAESGNKNLITDVGGAASILKAAFNSARLNVEINLKNINDGSFVENANKTLSEAEERIEKAYSKIESSVKIDMSVKGKK
jgi:formiminotetrahydrofolate cyclodeaminase